MFKRLSVNMTSGPIFKNIIAFAIPIVLTNILQLAFSTADLVVVGRFCGSYALGAIGATTSITALLVNIFIGVSTGVSVVISHSIGAGDSAKTHRAVHTALPFSIIIGLLLTVVGLAFCKPMLALISTPPELINHSATYMRFFFCGMTFSMVYNFCTAILRAAGDTKSPLIFLAISGITNVILNIIFVTLFNMAVAGVALATVISQALSAVLVVVTLMKRNDSVHIKLSEIRMYKSELFEFLRLGLPAGLQSSLFSIANVIIQSSVNSFGDVFLSGNSAAMNIENFVVVAMNAFYVTALNFIAQNYGAKDFVRTKKVFWACSACSVLSGLICGVFANLFSAQLLSIYITDSPEAISYGVVRLMYIALPFFLAGFMDVTTSGLRGIGASLTPTVISIVGICIFRLIWIFTVFSKLHTPEILYLSYPISYIITLIAQYIAFTIFFRRREREANLCEN